MVDEVMQRMFFVVPHWRWYIVGGTGGILVIVQLLLFWMSTFYRGRTTVGVVVVVKLVCVMTQFAL